MMFGGSHDKIYPRAQDCSHSCREKSAFVFQHEIDAMIRFHGRVLTSKGGDGVIGGRRVIHRRMSVEGWNCDFRVNVVCSLD